MKGKKQYHLPQEIEVWYIIPAIRKELAKLLTDEHDMTYQKTGDILGVSKAAISQYLSKKRATKIEIPSQIMKEIKRSSKEIAKNNGKALMEIEKILKLFRNSGCECDVCKKYNKGILKICGEKPIKRE